MSRVLVTGASGFVGLPCLAHLAAAGHEVHAVTRGEAHPDSPAGVRWHRGDLLEDVGVVERVAPEILVHLAWYAKHGTFWEAPENVEWVEASLRVLRGFVGAGGRRAVLVGTCAEYDWHGDGYLQDGETPLRPATLYGVSKDALRRVASAYAAREGTEIAWARLFFMYGPGEEAERLVPAVIRPLLAGKPAQTTSGSQVRDFMHVDDVGAALAALAEGNVTGAVNIATGEGVTIAEVVDMIGELAGAEQLIERGALPTRASDPPRIVGDASRLARELGFSPRIELRDGLAATIEWWRERTP